MDMIIALVSGLLAKYPAVTSVLVIIGGFRAALKPLREVLGAIVGATPTQKDDLMLTKVEGSKVYAAIKFVVDLLFSIKLPSK